MSPAGAAQFATSNVDQIVDACRHAIHRSHQARLLKTIAEDSIEDAAYRARRALKTAKRRFEDLGDLRDEAATRVRRQPLRAVGLAAAAGVALGLVAGWIGSRYAFRRTSDVNVDELC